jgi:deaminated glutathione amidase
MFETQNKFKVATVQMVSGPKVEENLKVAERLIIEAAQSDAKVIALPEYFPIMGMTDTDKVKVREQAGSGPIQQFLADISARYQVWIVAGTLPLECADVSKVRNTSFVYSPEGKPVARYDKIHLFGFQRGQDHYQESLTIERGHDPVALNTPYGRWALSVCYDLRFPELYRGLNQPDLIFVPAAFTQTTGQAHWEILLRARAIENLAYVIASGQGGVHPSGRETFGSSMIVDPWGTVLAKHDKGPGIAVAEIDPSYLVSLRSSLPALDHRILV